MFGNVNDNAVQQELLQTIEADFASLDNLNEKRLPNAFILFMKAVSPSVSQNNPNLSQNDVDKLIGKMWQMADDATRNEFREQAKQIAETFKSLHPDYVEPSRKKKVLTQQSIKSPEPIQIKVILNGDIQNLVQDDQLG